MAGQDLTGHETLSNEEIEKKISGASEASPETPTPAPPAKAEGGTPGEKGAEDTEHEEPEKPTPDESAKGEEAEPLYAGKYKSTDELEKGLGEALKRLNLPSSLYRRDLKEAKNSGDWSAIEEIYKDLESNATERDQARSKQEKDEQARIETERKAREEEATEQERTEIETKWNKFVIDEVNRQVAANSDLKEIFDAAGLAFPPTRSQLDELRKDLSTRYLYDKVIQAASDVIDECRDHLNEYLETVEDAKERQTSVRDEAQKLIKAKADRFKFGLTDEQIKSDIETILKDVKNPFIYDTQNGVQVLRDAKSVLYAWSHEMQDAYIDAAIIKNKTDGAIEHAEALRNNKGKESLAPSATKIAGAAARSRPAKVDLKDEQQVRALSGADVENMIAESFERGMKPE